MREPEALRFVGGMAENTLEPVLWAAVLLPRRKKIGVDGANCGTVY